MGADLFSIGQTSLRTSKRSLETTSHNIANSNTEGYSRQIITTENNSPISAGGHVFGTGVNVRSVRRAHDALVEKKLNNSLSQNSFDQERSGKLGQVEEIFNEINSEGMNKILNKFFNSFRELSNQPENEVVRGIVRQNASVLIEDFTRINDSIGAVAGNIDKSLASATEDINAHGKRIMELNKEIVRLENQGGQTGDLRDQRDNSVRAIAEYIPVNTYVDEKNQYVVNIVGAGSLVAGGIANQLEALNVQKEGQSGGQVEIYFAGNRVSPISRKIKSGRIGALIKSRNSEVGNLKDQINEIAHGLVHATNAIHRKGYANRNIQIDEQGKILPSNQNQKITGINFFKEPLDLSNAAEFIDLSDDIKDDLNNISTGLAPNSPGDNRIAIAISKLQHEKFLGDGSRTLEETYLQSVGNIGVAVSKSRINSEQSGGILAQAKSIKERISGVSMDEETANMVKFQHAYDASAKMLRTADEMFDSVLGMLR